MYGCSKDCLILIPFRLPQISCFTLSFVSPLTQTIALCGDRTPASVPPPAEGRSSPNNTPVFPLVPLSYRVLHGSIYSCPLIRYFCPLSAGVLQHFCIPDVSVERDILHVHLLLCHLALLKSRSYIFFFNTGSKTITYFLKV